MQTQGPAPDPKYELNITVGGWKGGGYYPVVFVFLFVLFCFGFFHLCFCPLFSHVFCPFFK